MEKPDYLPFLFNLRMSQWHHMLPYLASDPISNACPMAPVSVR